MNKLLKHYYKKYKSMLCWQQNLDPLIKNFVDVKLVEKVSDLIRQEDKEKDKK